MLSYIVSALDRPLPLTGCLVSLMVQTHKDAEIIVTDNGDSPAVYQSFADLAHRSMLMMRYVQTLMPTCYDSAEEGVKYAMGEWLCFPSDDSYYVPQFAELMLKVSYEKDIVYCDCIYDPRRGGKYDVMRTEPRTGHIDKTNFIVRKDWFEKVGGFPGKGPGSYSDGLFIEKSLSMGARHGKAEGILCFHN